MEMKKRNEEDLGASEFASTLNGDNPQEMLRVLKLFSKIVRRERRLALSTTFDGDGRGHSGSNKSEEVERDEDEDDESPEGDGSESESSPPPNKKYKKSETWKEDTEAYHVPFVGTSIAAGAESAQVVVKGEWPTGLLKSYLEKSPLAMELLNNDMIPPEGRIHKKLVKKKQGDLSRAMFKSYLIALAELISASFPTENNTQKIEMDRMIVDDDVEQQFLSIFLNKFTTMIFKVLNDETDKGRGKPGVYGGCGSWAGPALKLLRNLSLISTTHARLVARHLDEELSDGVLRILLRAPPPTARPSHPTDKDSDGGVVIQSKKCRIESIRLAITLLKSGDSAVNSYICTGGSRENKVKPGILYIALREGMTQHAQAKKKSSTTNQTEYYDQEHMVAVAEMLKAIRIQALDPYNSGLKHLFGDLLSRDALNNMCQYVSLAPSVKSEISLDDILAGMDRYHNIENIQNTGIEARRLVFLMLLDPSRSPLLPRITKQIQQRKGADQDTIKSILKLLEPPGGGLLIRQFLVRCVDKTPSLLPSLFGILSFPDPRNVFDFISSTSLVADLQRHGPNPVSCFQWTGTELQNDNILLSVLPVKYQKNQIGRALQSSNVIVVFQSLKILKTTVERFDFLRSELSKKWDDNRLESLTSSFSKCLPDVQLILALRSKFDAYQHQKAHVMISDCIFRIFETLSAVLPSMLHETKFDWTKLLPGYKEFVKYPALIQNRIMETLLMTITTGTGESTATYNSNQVKTVLEILLNTRNKKVYSMCRSVAQNILLKILQSTMEGKSVFIVKNEISCWMDALSTEYVEGCCNIVQAVSTNLLGLLSNIKGQAVKYAFSENVEFSIFLIAALNVEDERIADYVSTVATQCLLRQRNPIPLATLICQYSEVGSYSRVKSGIALVEYSKCLLEFDDNEEDLRLQKLGKALEASFDENSKWNLACQLVRGDVSNKTIDSIKSPSTFEDAMSFTRFWIHMNLTGNRTKSHSLEGLSRVVPVLILYGSGKEETSSILEDIFRLKPQNHSGIFSVLDQVIMSCPYSEKLNAIECKREECATALYDARRLGEILLLEKVERVHLLRLFLMEEMLSPECVLKTKIGLLYCVEDANKQMSHLALLWMLNFARHGNKLTDCNADYDPQVLRELVRCWWKVSEASNSPMAKKCIRTEVTSHLSLILAQMLKTDDLRAVVVEAAICEYDSAQCIDSLMPLCIKETHEKFHADSGNLILLRSLLESLSLGFEKRFLKAILSQHGKGLDQSWKRGFFDEAIVSALRKHKCGVGEDDDELYRNILDRIVTKTDEVLFQVLHGKEELSNIRKDMEMFKEIIGSFPLSTHVEAIAEKIVGILDHFWDSKNFKNSPCLKALVCIGMQLLEGGDTKKLVANQRLIGELATRIFVTLCELLPKSYRHGKSEDSQYTFEPDTIIAWLNLLLESVKIYNIGFMKKTEKSVLLKVCRSCLKFGVSSSSNACSALPCHSVRLVRTILENCHIKHFLLVPSPSDVFNMVTSHSRFAAVLADNDPADGIAAESTKIEILHLLRSCVDLDAKNIVIPDGFWKNVYSAFSAGLGGLDTAIRLFLQSCCTSDGKGIQIPFLDQLRWKGCPEKESTYNDSWDWLLSALDQSRIRNTVSHFPLFDAVHLDPVQCKKSDGNLIDIEQHEVPETEESNETSGSDESDSNDDSQSEESSVSVHPHGYDNHIPHGRPTNHGLSPGIPWNRDAQDNRYSPGFMLPLILGVVESCTLNSRDGSNSSNNNIASTEKGTSDGEMTTPQKRFSKNFIPTVHRLCEKGVASFCLASLASECVDIRKYAIAILGIFILALDSDEARNRSSWRERPQLAMLLNAVQRAFVLKRADKPERKPSIPVLSPLVSIFLARASISISRPDDALFPSLNHYFLKSESEYGAFQDMNRLPGFISLFCSSAEDPSVGRKERIWALQTLRDGFLHPSCYRLVSACHAPELILTSFENVRVSKSTEEMKGQEVTLLLEVLKKLIDYGSCTAVRHLVKLVGLLPWMRSVCVSRPLVKTFPTIAARRAFCNLVSAAIKAASLDQMLRKDILLQEASILSQSVLDVYLITASDSKTMLGQSNLVHSCCLALEELGCAFIIARDDLVSINNEMQFSGFSAHSGLQLLKAVSGDGQQANVVNSLSVLPMNMESLNPEDGAEFCAMLLHCITSSMTEDTMVAILQRVSSVGRRIKGSLESDSTTRTLKLLLLSRSKLSPSRHVQLLWLKCVELLSSKRQQLSEMSTEVTVVRQLLKQNND